VYFGEVVDAESQDRQVQRSHCQYRGVGKRKIQIAWEAGMGGGIGRGLERR